MKRVFYYSFSIGLFFLMMGLGTYATLTYILKSEDPVVVPDLIGKDILYTLEILSDLSLNTKVKGSEFSLTIPKHHVIRQDPEPGAMIKKGRDVRIVYSKGSGTIIMPNLKKLSLQQALIILEENNLRQSTLSRTYHENVLKDNIISQTPMPGVRVKQNTPVSLLISLGSKPVSLKMPDLTGITLDEATRLVEQAHLILGDIMTATHENYPKNVIVKQFPPFGHPVQPGTQINLTINQKGFIQKKKIADLQGVYLFNYRVPDGLLNKKITIRINIFSLSIDLFDDFCKPGDTVWALIPKDRNATVFLFVDDELLDTEVINPW